MITFMNKKAEIPISLGFVNPRLIGILVLSMFSLFSSQANGVLPRFDDIE